MCTLTADDQRAKDGRALAGVLRDAVKELRTVLNLVIRAEASQAVSYPGQVRGGAV